MGFSAPPTKRTRNNAGNASERISDVNSRNKPRKLSRPIGKLDSELLSRLIDRLVMISGELKQMDARVLTLEREVADPRSMRDRMG